ncbi:MAG: NAD-dependent protein deacylase [Selenomonadaceae bacterium]|nr:NAD-dependent protein deacylase [Selenomonadaceae bacterium]
MNKVDDLAEILKNSKEAVFFGGAGMSTESGIPDFRSADGIYSQSLNQKFRPEEMASHSFLVNHPKEFFEFYRQRMMFMNAKPNNGHLALATLEEQYIMKAEETQNIDGLHQMAGSKRVYELHGSSLRWPCMKCGKVYPMEYALQDENKPIPHCADCGGVVRPGVVLYEEGLDDETVENAIRAIGAADTLIVGGTSLVVYPAAGMIRYFRGKNLVIINKTETKADEWANLVIRDPIGETLHKAVSRLFNNERGSTNGN